jgi:hypothetical protein
LRAYLVLTASEKAEHSAEALIYRAAARIEALERCAETLRPFAKFSACWASKPLGNMDDEFYSIHTGTEWAASLRVSDMHRANAALSRLEAAK